MSECNEAFLPSLGKVGVRHTRASSTIAAAATTNGKASCPDKESAFAAIEDIERSRSLSASSVETVKSLPRQSSPVVSLAPRPTPGPSTEKMWRKRPHVNDDDDSESESSVSGRSSRASESEAPKRGRGRPPTTGEYVGYAAARAAFLKARRDELEFELEKELVEASKRATQQRPPPISLEQTIVIGSEQPALAPQEVVAAKLEDVRKVAAYSKNLKGTYQKLLKGAADSIQQATASLLTRSVNDETARLQADNFRLQAQLEELRREMACLRADLAKNRPAPAPGQNEDADMEEIPPLATPRCPPKAPARRRTAPVIMDGPAQIDMEALIAEIMRQVGTMLNARFEGLEARLLPVQKLRPPLAADAKKAKATAVAVPDVTTHQMSVSKATPAQINKAKKGKKAKAVFND
jgi:hypothetical protein